MAEGDTVACLQERPVDTTARAAWEVRVGGAGLATGVLVGWVVTVASWAVGSDMGQRSWPRDWK